MTTKELFPCPFCGGEAEICHVTQLWEPRDSYWAKCGDCHTSGKHHKTEAEAIAAWNTRAERTCHIETKKFPLSSVPMCSECGRFWLDKDSDNYCPNCGAKVVE